MSEVLVFSMGEFPAELPVEIQYASNHMWAERRDEIYRFTSSGDRETIITGLAT